MNALRRAVALAVAVVALPVGAGAAGWIKPLDLASDLRTPNSEQAADAIALSPNGTVVAGRVVSLPASQRGIRLVLRAPGAMPLAEQTVSTGTGGVRVTSLSVSVNDAGDAVAAWTEEDAGTTADVVWLTVRPHGQVFSPAVQPPLFAGDSTLHDPAVGIAADGTLTIAYGADCTSGNFSTTRAQALRRSLDGTWSDRSILASTMCGDGTGYRSFRLQELPDGQAIVGFRRTVVTEIWSAIRTAPTIVFTSLQMPTDAGTVDQPRVAIEAGGATVTAWTSANGVAYRYHPRSGADVDGAPIGGNGASEPAVAMGAGGEALLAFDSAGTPQATRISATGTAATPDPLGMLFGPGLTKPDLAATAQGFALVAFRDVGQRTSALVRPPAGTFGSTTELGTELSEFAVDVPRVAVDAAGDGAVLWMSYDSASGDFAAQVRVYDATPPQLGDLTAPSSVSVGAMASFSLAGTDTWGPVTLQWSFGDGAMDAGSPVAHAFSSPGPATVTATATDAAGNQASKQIVVDVVAPTTTTLPSDEIAAFVDHVRDVLIAAIQQAITSGAFAFQLDLNAPRKGNVTVKVTTVRAAALTIGTARKARTVVLAKGRHQVRKQGAVALAVRMTKAGKKLLLAGSPVTANVAVTFKNGAGKRSSSTMVVLSR